MTDRADVKAFTHQRAQAVGQALIEALIALALLGVLFMAQQWLGTAQWQALKLGMMGRNHAFAASMGAKIGELSAGYGVRPRDTFAHHAAQGESRRGTVTLRLSPSGALSAFHQSGGQAARDLRRDWRVEDTGVLRATASSTLPRLPLILNALAQSGRLILRRHTDMLRDDGHASSAAETVGRLGHSKRAWRDAFSFSQRAARRIASRVAGQDRAWHRSPVTRNWLTPWATLAPDDVRGRP